MEQNFTVGTAVLPARLINGQGKEAVRSRSMPLTIESMRFLKNAAAQLAQAKASQEPTDVFVHSHYAALRVAGAIVEAETNGARSRRNETIWQKLARVAPQFAQWAIVFEESATLRVRLEAGDGAWLSSGKQQFWYEQAQIFYGEAQNAFGVASLST